MSPASGHPAGRPLNSRAYYSGELTRRINVGKGMTDAIADVKTWFIIHPDYNMSDLLEKACMFRVIYAEYLKYMNMKL